MNHRSVVYYKRWTNRKLWEGWGKVGRYGCGVDLSLTTLLRKDDSMSPSLVVTYVTTCF